MRLYEFAPSRWRHAPAGACARRQTAIRYPPAPRCRPADCRRQLRLQSLQPEPHAARPLRAHAGAAPGARRGGMNFILLSNASRNARLEHARSALIYSQQQARRDGSCNPDGGSPSTYSALPTRHWHALHCAECAPVARDGATSLKSISATGAILRRVERSSPAGPSMTVLPCLCSLPVSPSATRVAQRRPRIT